jgi:hypothetical protein
MTRARSWRLRLSATFLALVMAFVSAAVCYAGTLSEQAGQMCCAEMGSDCPDMAMMPTGLSVTAASSPHGDCCSVPPINVASTGLLTAVAPATDWVAIQPPLIVFETETGFAGSSFDSTSPPTYLLVSTFRI